ncbi:MAG: hypothetical protein NVS1B2_00620 [Vulcanimicrobiaceae bacterium]
MPPGSATPVNLSTPELAAFRKAWNGVVNYRETIVAHETSNDGKHVQDRTYRYSFVRPLAALVEVLAGPGHGGAVAWHGGPTVRGHQGGFLAGVKLTLAKDNPRVTSLRGDRIDDAAFGAELDRYATIPGTLVDGKAADGSPTVTLTPKTAEPSGVTREMLTFSQALNLPTKREQFVGDRLVKSESFSQMKVNDPALTAKDIDL